MRRIAFTGPSRILDFEAALVIHTLDQLPPPSNDIQIITGACIGVDELVAITMHSRGYNVHTVVPGVLTHVDPAWREHCTSSERLSPTSDRASTFRLRNTRMVGQATELIAFLRNGQLARNGESMTYSIARKAGKPIQVVAL